MSVIFDPSGNLDISTDPSDLPESGSGNNITSGAMTRCKNLRINQKGIAQTRDGSAKVNATAIDTAIWWIEEQNGVRYVFAGDEIYKDETSIESGLTEAQWAAIKYNAFNETTEQVFALNGTDRKRIEDDDVYEWGIAAPTTAPTLSKGQGTGLTGQYNVKYTYVRKVDGVVVAESNPSPSADAYLTLNNESLAVSVTAPTDSQVTHIRLYRTEADGLIYYRDQDIPVGAFAYGVCFTWEGDGEYLAGEAFKFTVEDSLNDTENTYTWEETHKTVDADSAPNYGASGQPWWNENAAAYNTYLAYLKAQGIPYWALGAPL